MATADYSWGILLRAIWGRLYPHAACDVLQVEFKGPFLYTFIVVGSNEWLFNGTVPTDLQWVHHFRHHTVSTLLSRRSLSQVLIASPAPRSGGTAGHILFGADTVIRGDKGETGASCC